MNFLNRQALATLVCVAALSMGLMAGCTTQAANSNNSEQSANRTYMTEVNQVMETLQSRLSSFNDAVSREDVVSMRTQADNAFKALDQLENLDTPSALKDVQESYEQGTSDLKDALNDYIDLYTEIQNASDESPFDWSTYDSRIADIKALYDKGIEALEDADSKAASLPN